ncbi:prefoldin subunit 2 isoform X2 [Molothrus aeneus]|uniref:prefoldin subunit 2 isoform X2 n=1 Tax=Molothrus aeneus TaxID=84833 RepID=UPI0034586B42
MAEPGKGRGAAPAGKGLSAEQVVSRFNRLRQDQRGLASKAAELELELNEHTLVIETLREVDPTRKCFRMVGGVLVERTVKEVLPALESNREQISTLTKSLSFPPISHFSYFPPFFPQISNRTKSLSFPLFPPFLPIPNFPVFPPNL